MALAPFALFAVGVYHQWFDIGDAYTPVGDWSLLEMRVRDVGHAWLTTGAYSRFGSEHRHAPRGGTRLGRDRGHDAVHLAPG